MLACFCSRLLPCTRAQSEPLSESLARAQARSRAQACGLGGARAEVTACRERSLHPRPGTLSPPPPQAIKGGSSARGSPTAPRRCQSTTLVYSGTYQLEYDMFIVTRIYRYIPYCTNTAVFIQVMGIPDESPGRRRVCQCPGPAAAAAFSHHYDGNPHLETPESLEWVYVCHIPVI